MNGAEPIIQADRKKTRRLNSAFAPLRGANARVARLRQALRREPVVRPDFLPRQSGATRPLPGQKVGQLARCTYKLKLKGENQ